MPICGGRISIHSSSFAVIFIVLIVLHEQQQQTQTSVSGFVLQELPLYAEVVRKHDILLMSPENRIATTNKRRRHRRMKQGHREVLIRLI